MDYKQDKSYEFEVIGIERDHGDREYFSVRDADGAIRRVYNVFPGQRNQCPQMVTARVLQIDITGRIKLAQDVSAFIQSYYSKDDVIQFRVVSIDYDQNGRSFYNLEDAMMRHRLYFNGERKYQVGDPLTLTVSGFDSKGFLIFTPPTPEVAAPTARKVYVPTDSQETVLADIGEESSTLELKTSIVYPPGTNGIPDIAKQCFTVLKVLVSFMNASGGELYIGVHDKTYVVTGIEKDYSHLNEDEDDYYTYPDSRDGFELKLRNTLRKESQCVANELINFEFKTAGEHDYCIIHVQKANRPIWLHGNKLFQRVGNQCQQLNGDDINNFVVERMARPIIESQAQTAQPLDTETFTRLFREVLNEQRPKIIPQTAEPTSNIPREWYIWFNNGSLKRYTNTEYEKIKDSLQDDHFRLPVCSSDKDYIVVLCYASGFINMVTVKDLKESIPKRTKIIKDGYNLSDNAWPIHIYLAHPSDMLAGFSTDAHGTEYVKIHHLTAYNPTSHPKNKGALFIPKTGIITDYKLLPATVREHVKPLILDSSKTSTDFGVPMSSVSCADAVQFISSYQ